ncbi:Alpha/beta knot methyltransferase [Absidia repens]|uniref:rRNA methyltransferase 1, mitochondrial n=1 Tax=Absidia repens TaxID=90262 RepID=A0A1X2ISD7_9FUNG|nr:Alpha/beta knot methyltransferase [Absidia repens]
MFSPRSFSRSSLFLLKRYHSTYTTSSTEYVYGLSSVACALHAKKRTVNELYVQHRLASDSLTDIITQCKEQGIPVRTLDKGRLNNMTMNKPHQGVVLEASARRPIPIKALGWATSSNLEESVDESSYTAISTSSKSASLIFQKPRQRSPLWIALDQVQDPQNLGSIIRTAHFFGVDGLLVCSKNSAPLSAAVSKVSSGAMEIMDVYTTQHLVKFLETSRDEGWHIIGAASESTDTEGDQYNNNTSTKPRILVFGNEGTGLRTNVKRCCDSLISIPGAQRNGITQHSGFVDSLNVGVAMGVLVSTLL